MKTVNKIIIALLAILMLFGGIAGAASGVF